MKNNIVQNVTNACQDILVSNYIDRVTRGLCIDRVTRGAVH